MSRAKVSFVAERPSQIPNPDAQTDAAWLLHSPPVASAIGDEPPTGIPTIEGGLADGEAPIAGEQLVRQVGPLFDMIRHKDTQLPLTAAIYGPWGSGKSTAMRWIDRMLKSWKQHGRRVARSDFIDTRTVWFYPWKYQEREDVLRGIIAEIIRVTIQVKGADRKTIRNAVRLFGGFLGESALSGLDSVTISSPNDTGIKVEPGKALRGAIKAFRKANHPESIFLNHFEEALSSWIRHTIPRNKRLVVFIDDLDRCQPRIALQVLEALKLYLRVPRTIFVVGVDRAVITAQVESVYERDGVRHVDAHRYLAKMFQVEVTLDAEEDLAETCFDDAVQPHEVWSDFDERVREMIRDYVLENANRNPRDVKRLFNGIIMGAAGQLHRDRAFASQHDNQGDNARSLFRGAQRVMIRHRIEAMVDRELDDSVRKQRLQYCLESIGKRNWNEFRDWYASVMAFTGTPGTLAARPKDIANYELLLEDNWVERILGKRDAAAWRQAILDGESENLRIIRSCVASSVEKRPHELTDQDLRHCRTLVAEQTGISHLPPILALTQLHALDIAINDIQVTKELEELRYLRHLDVQETGVKLSVLSGLVNLELLNIARNSVADLSPISQLTQLKSLKASHNTFTDLRPLAGMVKLKQLDIEHTPVVDLSPLEALTELEFLSITGTKVLQVHVLHNLPKLKTVHLEGIPAPEEAIKKLREHLRDREKGNMPPSSA